MNAAMQEVNLYQPVSKGVRSALSASSTRAILVLVCATLSGLWGFAYWQVGRLDTAAQLVRDQQQAQAALSAAQVARHYVGRQRRAGHADRLHRGSERETVEPDAVDVAHAERA